MLPLLTPLYYTHRLLLLPSQTQSIILERRILIVLWLGYHLTHHVHSSNHSLTYVHSLSADHVPAQCQPVHRRCCRRGDPDTTEGWEHGLSAAVVSSHWLGPSSAKVARVEGQALILEPVVEPMWPVDSYPRSQDTRCHDDQVPTQLISPQSIIESQY